MKTKDILIEKQREYIALLKDQSVKSNLIDWQEKCNSLDAEIKILEEKLLQNSKSINGNITMDEAKRLADKIRDLKGTDWGLSF